MDALQAEYKKRFNIAPYVLSNGPGRLNIIGEHTDHQNFDVLPFCIEQHITVLGGLDPKSESFMEIQHLQSSIYPTAVYKDISDIFVDQMSGKWSNYIVCALLGILEYTKNNSEQDVGQLINSRIKQNLSMFSGQKVLKSGVKLLITGNIPVASGLSSSSALVVASLKALNLLADMPEMPNEQVARLSISAERHCGTASGGMDQTIICLGKEGVAKQIKFAPMETFDVDLPACISFVVCNSLCKSAKAETAPFHYNKRVLELRVGCLLLADIIAKDRGAPKKALGTLPVLKTVYENYGLTMDELSKYVEQLNDSYTKQNVLDYMKKDILAELEQYCGKQVMEKNTEFKMKQRLRHVITENARVSKFKASCDEAKANKWPKEKVMETLGGLLKGSMASLAGDFECSVAQLDALCKTANEFNGCAGSRLTGAGWGGAILAMVEAGKEDALMSHMVEEYYKPQIANKSIQFEKSEISRDTLSGNLFATKASAGATAVKI